MLKNKEAKKEETKNGLFETMLKTMPKIEKNKYSLEPDLVTG